MKPKYGVNIQSLMTDTDSFVYEIRTDTDSFVYEIKTEDFYADMKGIKEHYDMSEDWKESGLYDGENIVAEVSEVLKSKTSSRSIRSAKISNILNYFYKISLQKRNRCQMRFLTIWDSTKLRWGS